MSKQVFRSLVLVILAGLILLGLVASNTTLARDYKKLDYLQKKFNIDDDSQPIVKPVLVYPNYKAPYVQSVLPGPLVPPPDTTRKR